MSKEEGLKSYHSKELNSANKNKPPMKIQPGQYLDSSLVITSAENSVPPCWTSDILIQNCEPINGYCFKQLIL